jgi:hypothetical protein
MKMNMKHINNDVASIKQAIDNAWETKQLTMEWYQLESCLVAIIQCETISDPNDKLAMIKDSIDAFTRRGHFNEY